MQLAAVSQKLLGFPPPAPISEGEWGLCTFCCLSARLGLQYRMCAVLTGFNQSAHSHVEINRQRLKIKEEI
jgi:hypothetical protein